MLALERILTFGVTGSGKSYQWLKMARTLLPTGAKFRCIDTDNAIPFMLQEQFPDLMPENKGNVYIYPAFEWPEYQKAVAWLQRKPGLSVKELEAVDPFLAKDYTIPLQTKDWSILDLADNPWKHVQSHFTEGVFGKDKGEYFLQVRREMEAGGRRTKDGKEATSVVTAALDGWKDWSVINSLYDDFINPFVYRVRTHVYATTKVEKIDRTDKDAEMLMLFGDLGVKPTGQKAIGNQFHSIFLMIPGQDKWYITTAKDRGKRSYFKKTPLTDFYNQYLVMKAGWEMV